MTKRESATPPHCLGVPHHWFDWHRTRSARPRHRRAMRRYAPMCHEMTMRASGWNSSRIASTFASSGAPDQACASRPLVTASRSKGAWDELISWTTTTSAPWSTSADSWALT